MWHVFFLCLLGVAFGQICADQPTCDQCSSIPLCGWCWSSQKCINGTASGPALGAGQCMDYAWLYMDPAQCPDNAQTGCAAQRSCSSCLRKNRACTWCVANNTCVVIDSPGGGSSMCGMQGRGLTSRSCGTCQGHVSCLACQRDNRGCFWCPSEQMCLPTDGGAQCRGLATLPGQCRLCSAYTDCVTCNAQPDCAFCNAGGTGSCVTRSTCENQNVVRVCSEQCAKATTCPGCLVMQDCNWVDGKCGARVAGQPLAHSCPKTGSSFDAASFVGGIFLTLGLIGIVALTVAVYRCGFPPSVSERLVLSGGAKLSSGSVRVTSNTTRSSGAVWYALRVWADEFRCNFSFLAQGAGSVGGDGVSFVLFEAPDVSADTFAPDAGGLGYGDGLPNRSAAKRDGASGLPLSVAVEFDSHHDEPLGDPRRNHVAVHSLGALPNSANESVAKLALSVDHLPVSFRNTIVPVGIIYVNGQLSIYVSGSQRPTISFPIDILNWTQGGEDPDGIFVGITSSTGRENADDHSLLEWSFAYTGNRISAANSRVFGGAWDSHKVVAGQVQRFTIEARDVFNHSYYGELPFLVKPSRAVISLTVSRNTTNPSLFEVAFSVALVGPVDISVTLLNGNPVGQSFMQVSPGTFSPKNSRLGGQFSGGTVGKQISFTLTTADAYGNRVDSPGSTISVTFSGQGPEASVDPCGACNGLYTIQYSSTVRGVFNMTVTVDGVEILGSPFRVGFSSGAVSPTRCTAFGDGVTGGSVAQDIVFNVQLRDLFFNPVVVTQAEAPLSVAIKDNFRSGVTIEPESAVMTTPGVYTVTWVTTVASTYTYDIRINNEAIYNSPITLVIVQPDELASANYSTVSSLANVNAKVGKLVLFNVTGRDRFNNTMAVDPQFSVTVFQRDVEQNSTWIYNSGPGVTTMAFVPLTPGLYEIYVSTVLGQPLNNGFPYSLRVSSGDISSLYSTVQGSGLGTNLVAGTTLSLTISLFDDWGNAITPPANGNIPVQVVSTPQVVLLNWAPITGGLVVNFSLPEDRTLYRFSCSPSQGVWRNVPMTPFPRLLYSVNRGPTFVSVVALVVVALAVAALGVLFVLLVVRRLRASNQLEPSLTEDPISVEE